MGYNTIMNRSRLFFLALAAVALLPALTFAATADFFGPIVPDACNCPNAAAGWGCVVQVVGGLLKFAISFGIIIAVLMFAYAGFLWVLNPMNPENRSAGRKMLINAAIGLVLTLSAWLIVNTLLNVIGAGGIAGTTSSLGKGTPCIAVEPGGGGGGGGGITATTTPPTPSPTADGKFTYDSGVQAEVGAESGALSSMLSCMANIVPGNVGRISAITDLYSGTDTAKIAHCDAVGSKGDSNCAHTANSCHYGGTCGGASYAVDFGDEENANALRAAGRSCNAGAKWNPAEAGTHVHISVGTASGCACDTGLSPI
jgi:hypothetical protein